MKIILVATVLMVVAFVGNASALTMGPPEELKLPDDINCLLTPQKGPCKATFEKYYFDRKDERCKPFFWGGCDGVVPFETSEKCEEVCELPRDLRVTEIKALNDIYAAVSIEFPKTWTRPEFQVTVDDKEVNVKNQSGGFTEDRQTMSLLFFPGKAGAKQITVHTLVDGRTVTATITLNWSGRPFVALLWYGGDRTLLTGAEEVKIITVNLDNIAIKVNNRLSSPKMVGQDAKLFSLVPDWHGGLNTVVVEGRDKEGRTATSTYTFVYSPLGIRKGETAAVRIGVEGTRSGPFYSVTIKGDAVSMGAGRSVNVYFLSDDGWIGQQTLLVKDLKALKPGKATVLISEKPYFLREKALKEEIPLIVLPADK
jgi:hypothetical protein